MKNIFSKVKATQVETIQKPMETKRSVNEIIEEIHESFYTEVDKLLAEAKISKSVDTDKQELLDKCERLRKLGFNKAKEVVEAEAEIARLNAIKEENKTKSDLIEAINYFSFKYPNYKFITENSVKTICEKYGLVYGSIDKYTGTVPDKNLKHMEDFSISEDDDCYMKSVINYSLAWGRSSEEVYVNKKESLKIATESTSDAFIRSIQDIIVDKLPLEIAAPVSDFDMNGQELKDFKLSKIQIPDPIVLKPVIFKGQKHFLIVTAWGLEGSDELVVNEKHN